MFSLLQHLRTGSGAHPPSYSMGTFFHQRVKRPGLEFDHSGPPSAQIQNEWSYTSTPHYVPSRPGQGRTWLSR